MRSTCQPGLSGAKSQREHGRSILPEDAWFQVMRARASVRFAALPCHMRLIEEPVRHGGSRDAVVSARWHRTNQRAGTVTCRVDRRGCLSVVPRGLENFDRP
jgi:hypothetical protein